MPKNKPTDKALKDLDKSYLIDGKEVKPTRKQLSFVRSYILNGGNGTQAAIEAGYSKNAARQTAAENIAKPVVKLMLDEVKQEEAEAFSVSVEKKKRWLDEIVERSLQHEKVTDHKGQAVGDYQFDASSAIRAINELNKMDGDHSPEKKNIKLDANHRYQEMSDEELQQELKRKRAMNE